MLSASRIITRGIATGGPGGHAPPPPFSLGTTHGLTVSVSNIWDIAFYWCSEIIWTRNFTVFIVYAIIFGQFTTGFDFFNLYRRNQKGPILNDGLTENVFIADHLKEDHNE